MNQHTFKYVFLVLAGAWLMMQPVVLNAQVVVGGETPDPSAALDIQGAGKGFLIPRLTTAERNAIASPATGLIIYNTTTLCLEVNTGTSATPDWSRSSCKSGVVTALNCGSATVTGTLVRDLGAAGVSVSVPYTGGNGYWFAGQTVSSTGVTGLTATAAAVALANGSGSITYTIAGTPAALGNAEFALSVGGQTCNLSIAVSGYLGTVSQFTCSNAVWTGTSSLWAGRVASGVTATISYTGGTGGVHPGQTVTSTGVTGLTATLAPGTIATGAGTFVYNVTGTPASTGVAYFVVNIAGKTCNLAVSINSCRAKVSATEYKNFLCYNLGAANTNADPYTPGWEINGGYWQWGRLAQAAAGPTGSGPSQANDAAIGGWTSSLAPNNSWAGAYKTVNDPCPAGYKVPSKSQWDGVLANNTRTYSGSFTASSTNYGSGVSFGTRLVLPVAGYRDNTNGSLSNRGLNGLYWSSTEYTDVNNAYVLDLGNGTATGNFGNRGFGRSVRCIEEDPPGSIGGSLNCSGATVTGTLRAGAAASGVSASVPYTGGVSGPHSGQTVTSTGVTGLTATLSPGLFSSGAGSLSYAITGTPSATGTATFALNIGGQTCNLTVSVTGCRAKVNATDFKNFLCHNLGAANTSANPFTPSWEINGGYWQWGRLAQAAAGPTGSGSGQANDGAISGWNTIPAPNGSWSDGIKTANDPCPSGYKVPSKAQWDGVVANNTSTLLGTFSSSATNYSSGRQFGTQLMLPAVGTRDRTTGALADRGFRTIYWSSTENSSDAFYLFFNNSTAGSYSDARHNGSPVRCIEEDPPGSIGGSLNCPGATVTGTLTVGSAASGVSVSVPYTGGVSGPHSGQTVTSTGVTGLTATLSPGVFSSGAGSLSYAITGTPSATGTATFALNIGGQTCNLTVSVTGCRAKVNATDFKNFLCHNLGAANTSADPFIPSWEINGGYWQWGRLAQAAAGPTGSGSGQANDGAISGWNTTPAPNGSWADGFKTANDPCPSGYKVPSKAQWDGVNANNTSTILGTFSSSATNYSSGRQFGTQLMLPAVGTRDRTTGALADRGFRTNYWSSTENSNDAFYLFFNNSIIVSSADARHNGSPVRCIEEDPPGSIGGTLNCPGATVTGTLTVGSAASGVSVSVPYTGGVSGPHSGQTVTSTGVTGLTATLSPGAFSSGAGSLSYAITGTPSATGTATFALNIGGQTCNLTVSVTCRAKVSSTAFKGFLCHNLGSANTSADPFTPSWEINGGYWQWGRSAQAAAGPTGSGSSQANDGVISGWSTTDAANGSWSDGIKTANDPCPSGYKVPSKAQWDGVVANNTSTLVGTFNSSATNYSCGRQFGTHLMLPAAGYRNTVNGLLVDRGGGGYYWSSMESVNSFAWYLLLSSNYAGTDYYNRTGGLSVRCIEQ